MQRRLYALRKYLKYDIGTMAMALHLSHKEYILYELYGYEIPEDMIMDLENLLKVNIDWLRTGDGDMFIKDRSA